MRRKPDWVSIADLAREKEISTQVVTNWIARGKIPCKDYGARARFVDRNACPIFNRPGSGKTIPK